MNKSKNKDKLLNDIRNNSFDYNAGSHATMIADFERDGLVIVSRTKDGVDCDITDMGASFLCDGGYVAIAKKEKKKKDIEVDCRSNHCNSNRSDCIFDSCTKIAISNPIIIPDVMQSR